MFKNYFWLLVAALSYVFVFVAGGYFFNTLSKQNNIATPDNNIVITNHDGRLTSVLINDKQLDIIVDEFGGGIKRLYINDVLVYDEASNTEYHSAFLRGEFAHLTDKDGNVSFEVDGVTYNFLIVVED